MKIKFLKPFRLYNPIGDDLMMDEGTVENMEKEDYAKWLIDNGFAEEVKESGWWKPKLDDIYYVVYPDGLIASCTWDGCPVDENRFFNGAIFKTEEAAERWRDYLKAIATVHQDEGVLTPEQINERIKNEDLAYYVGYAGSRSNGAVLCGCTMGFDDCCMPLGVILFDTEEHADASCKKHQDEWEVIANYDWSRE